MIQFVVFALSGFIIVWINTLFWGFTGGPASVAPYFALVGGLMLFVLASGVVLFLPRVGSLIAFIATVLVIPWPVLILVQEYDASGVAMCGAPPVIAGAVATFQLARSRREPFLIARTSPHWTVRLIIALLPLATFMLCFNALLVLEIIFRYPFS